jgi:mRNA interferase YafQ
MRRVKQWPQFRADLRRQRQRGRNLEDLFAAIGLLAEDGELPASYRPHRLTREWSGFWECHIEPDWLLIYDVNDDQVSLVRTGTHSDLFE